MSVPAANPQPIALVICDNIYSDAGGKRALVGLFNRISTLDQTGPIIQRRMVIYVSMTEVYRHSVVCIDCVDAESEQVIFEMKTPPAPANINPTTIFELEFELRDLVFPDSGTYYIRFSANGAPLLQRPIEVIREPLQQQPKKEKE